MAEPRARILIKTLSRIPLFTGLDEEQIRTVLGASQPRRIEAGTRVCDRDTPVDELFVLLSGSLAVTDEDGAPIAILSPVTTMGEVGMLTGQRRRAAIEALDSSNVLLFTKSAFEQMLSSDSRIGAQVYRNIVTLLAGKLVQDNVRTREYLREKVDQEKRLKEFRQRAELAADWLVAETDFDARQVQRHLDEQVLAAEPLRVIVVDDDPAIRRMLCEALADFDTREARDGEEALDEIGEDAPDLVITDIRMPGMDGYRLLDQLRQRFPDMPVLGISGFATEEDVHDHEFDGFIEKPMNLKDFRQLVESTMGI